MGGGCVLSLERERSAMTEIIIHTVYLVQLMDSLANCPEFLRGKQKLLGVGGTPYRNNHAFNPIGIPMSNYFPRYTGL